jgi:hypothetical protein
MSADANQDNQAPPDRDRVSDRQHVHNWVLSRCLATQGLSPVFQGLSWDYLLADVELGARAARVSMRDMSVGSVCDTILLLPPPAIARLLAALFVYFQPFSPENEAHADYLLQPLDAATVKVMRQRRHAVHAMQAVEAKQQEARKAAAAQDDALLTEWYNCPHAQLSSEPEDFLPWIKLQTPDTWHVMVEGWDYNYDNRDDVIEWIFEQPNCDLGTAAKFFFTAGLADRDPEQLSSGYRRKWNLMKRIADNWQRGLYVRNELAPNVAASDIAYYDELVVRREAEGRPLPWTVPGPKARRFGARRPQSAYSYDEPGHLQLNFAAWKQHRDLGCGKPRCCESA